MEYVIAETSRFKNRIAPIFEESYQGLLGVRWRETFERAVANAETLSLLIEDGEIVAFCMHRQMKCVDWRNPPAYMADTPESFLKHIEKKFLIYTGEWLTVERSRLGKFSKIQPGDLLMGLDFRFMANSICDATVGFSRQDLKVDRLTTRFGADLWGTVERLGLPCSVVLMEGKKLQPHPISRAQEKIEQLWATRKNHFRYLEKEELYDRSNEQHYSEIGPAL